MHPLLPAVGGRRMAPLAILLAFMACAGAADDPLVTPATGDEAEAAAPPSIKAWDAALFAKGGKIARAAYIRACSSLDPRDVDRRLGPSADAYGASAGSAPIEIGQRIANGIYDWKNPPAKGATDWTGCGGQVAFVGDRPDALGISRVAFSWSVHEKHGGKEFWHRYWLRAGIGEKDGGQWWSRPVDPCLEQDRFREAMRDDPARVPVAIGRALTSWSNHALVCFRNGVITTAGSGNSGDKYPIVVLPKGKVPTAVALTGGNEFALVTVWDVAALKGQVAVIAMRAKKWMMPANGFYADMRLVGFVDLPEGMRAPTSIATSIDFVVHDINHVEDALWKLDDPAVRRQWADAPPGGLRFGIGYPRRGYAVVSSRAESRVVLLDLAPLLRWARTQCLEQTPPTDAAGPPPLPPEALPKLAGTIPVPQPTFVTCGWPPTGKPSPWATRFLVGTLDGRLIAFDAGHLVSAEAAPAAPKPIGMVQVGRNPCMVSHGGRAGNAGRMWVVCRGERAVVEVDALGATPRVLRALRDARLKDPVSVSRHGTRGANLISVADFSGRQIINYLTEPISPWGDQVFGGLGDGDDAWECAGVTAVAGRPFYVGGAEVP